MECVIDASNHVIGRLASIVAKLALEGNVIHVVNCKNVLITGNKLSIVEDFNRKLRRGDPYKGPFYPKTPEGIVRRTIRGMIPYKKYHGRIAFKNIKTYRNFPKELSKLKKYEIERKEIRCKYINLSELCYILNGGKYD